MIPRRYTTAVAFGVASFIVSTTAASQPVAPTSAVSDTIGRLGSFDFQTRTAAAHDLRRTTPAVAVPALQQAVQSHADQYVRFRALVLLSGFGEAASGAAMRAALSDRNDRLRTVACQWYEHHPDTTVLLSLITALGAETSEFVRPALTRAIAAQADRPPGRDALLPLIMRGEDLFRGALIQALGDYGVRDALPLITEVASREGPLQDDAITAMGMIGDAAARRALMDLRRAGSREVQPTVAAASCLLGMDCPGQEDYLRSSLASAVSAGDQQMLRAVVHALAVLAIEGRSWAVGALLDAGSQAADAARAPVALAVGLVAFRQPGLVLDTVVGRGTPSGDADLLRDAFDMLSEDLEEERFYVEIRQMRLASPPPSARGRVAELLIERLEF